MTEPLFFSAPEGVTAQEIAKLTGAVLQGDAPPQRRITGVAPLDRAGPSDLTFMQNVKYESQYAVTEAGICLAPPKFLAKAPAGVAIMLTPMPYRAFVTVAQTLYPKAMRPSSLFEASGIATSAQVHPSARLEAGVIVDPAAVIGPRAEIGSGTVIGPTAVIGPDVRIGRDCAVGAGATVMHALIGDRVLLHPGVRIGQDGFGFVPGARGLEKVPQLRRVIIQDDVEIGANSTIDRGAIRDTVIGEGTKIDNLVQIAHNVEIGRRCLVAALSGISGSTVIGDFVMMGGQVGLADNLIIGQGAQIAAGSGVAGDIPAGAKYGGSPAVPAREWLKGHAAVRRLARQGGTAFSKRDEEADE